MCPDKAAALLIEFRSKLDRLSLSLPSRFVTNLDAVRKELPLLFLERLPFILSHQDLNEMNMLIDPETGCITGIVDWAEARILPFGFSLWAFENLLGYMDSEGWHYYDNRQELEGIFWQTILAEANSTSDGDIQLIRVARMAVCFFVTALTGTARVWRMLWTSPASLPWLISMHFAHLMTGHLRVPHQRLAFRERDRSIDTLDVELVVLSMQSSESSGKD